MMGALVYQLFTSVSQTLEYDPRNVLVALGEYVSLPSIRFSSIPY